MIKENKDIVSNLSFDRIDFRALEIIIFETIKKTLRSFSFSLCLFVRVRKVLLPN